MNKLAIFVEGQTELLFMDKLLSEIANANHLLVEHYHASGGNLKRFKMTKVEQIGNIGAQHYVQIVNCGSDENVKSYINERYSNLITADFWAAIGIRDVFPKFSYAQISSLRAGMAYGMPVKPVRVEFILGVMEIESWFIAEHTHFERIDASLKNSVIAATAGFDPATTNLELRTNPADDLDKIYRIAGQQYTKKRANCLRTIQNLDYAAMYCELGNRFSDFRNLTGVIDEFLNL